MRSHPTWWAACRVSSTRTAGISVCGASVGGAPSSGCGAASDESRCRDSAPVNTVVSSSRVTAAPSSGCSAGLNPSSVGSPLVRAGADGQKERRRKAYVGRSTGRPGSTRSQSIVRPCTDAAATASTNPRASSPRPGSAAIGCATTSAAWAARPAPGPISTQRVTPSSARVRMPSWKRTASRRCRRQYCGDVSSSAVATRPVRVETTGIVGGCAAVLDTTVVNSSRTGSISAEWNARSTRSGVTGIPAVDSSAATVCTSAAAPASTTDSAPLTAARSTRPSIRDRMSSGRARTAIIAPGAVACISRPRAATRAAASGRLNTPATWAAASSPIECPIR